MIITALKSKLHRACITHSELDYEGSLAIDANLLRQANISQYEQLHVYNLSNGERFTTYALMAEAGSGIVSANGAAAHKAKVGERVIVCTYASLEQAKIDQHCPILVYLNERNEITRTAKSIPPQST
ncbi:MAG: aspartate 1-decarboxylase [Candidatus Oxydemutatoraceae bacterium WSBS_2016_MAG_OTU14]